MKRYSLTILVLVVALVPLSFWLFDSGYRQILREVLSEDDLLTIRGRLIDNDTYHIRVTYHYPPGIGLFAISEFTATRPIAGWKFNTVHDQQTGMLCVYDQNDLGWLWIYNAADGDIWESSPNRASSFHATSREIWELRYSTLRKTFPEIPYPELPNNMN